MIRIVEATNCPFERCHLDSRSALGLSQRENRSCGLRAWRQAREQWDLPEMTVLNGAILDLGKLQEGATPLQPPGVSDVPCHV